MDSIRKPLPGEKVDLLDGPDRVLACDIRAKCTLPPFDNSAMDGYALRSHDTQGASKDKPRVLKVIEDLRAGYIAKKIIKDNQAIRIMTGASIPRGADSVVMVEFTKKVPGAKEAGEELIEVFKEVKMGENVRKAGEDVKKGEKVLKKGTILRPEDLGLLAALGVSKIKVARRPRVGILATGDELIDVKERLSRGKIRNSNSYILSGQIIKSGGIPVDLGIAKDDRRKVRRDIEKGLKEDLDILVVIGGISVGDYDLVKDVLLELGMDMRFWRVAMRPGKPLAFGTIDSIPVFGLPGNPVSSAITFEEFVRPSILKMQGVKNLFRPVVTAILMEGFRKKKGLRYFIRVKLKNKAGKFYAVLTGPQGSGIINSLVLADGILIAPEEVEELKKGAMVSVRLLRHGCDGEAV